MADHSSATCGEPEIAFKTIAALIDGAVESGRRIFRDRTGVGAAMRQKKRTCLHDQPF
jgi:hypothetical protein